MKKTIMSILMALAIPSLQASSFSRLGRTALESCRKCYMQAQSGAKRFTAQIPAMRTKAKVVAGGLVGGSSGYGLKSRMSVNAEEERREHVDIFPPRNEDIFSKAEGPVNPVVYREPVIEKPVNQPKDYTLSQFIPKSSPDRARLLNQTYSEGQMVIDDTGDEYHVFIKNPDRFFNVYEPRDFRFYVYKEGTGVAVKGDTCVNAGIEFPVPLAKEILSTDGKSNYITPIAHPDGTLEFVLKKDASYNDSIFNKVWNLWGYWNKDSVSYWASDRPRDPRLPLSGPWWAS
jgi:type II secretory pathway pseudopilin PulG